MCAGAKSILDLPRTLELLETLSVPVIGYGTNAFPAFYVRSSGGPVSGRADSPEETARILAAHWSLGGAGIVLAQPVAEDKALAASDLEAWLERAEGEAAGIRGRDVTPFLLSRLADLSGGQTLRVNQDLVVANARLAARVARAYHAIVQA